MVEYIVVVVIVPSIVVVVVVIIDAMCDCYDLRVSFCGMIIISRETSVKTLLRYLQINDISLVNMHTRTHNMCIIYIHMYTLNKVLPPALSV